MKRSKADAEQTRLTILEAAQKLFFTRGVAATSLDRIATEAGVTRGAIYWHFKDKADLMMALRKQYCLPQEDMITRAAVSGHPDPISLLESKGAEVLRLFEQDEGMQRMFLITSTQMPGTPEAEGIRRVNAEMFDVMLKLMERARKNGQLAPHLDPPEAAVYLMVSMNGLLNEWLRSGRAFPLCDLGAKLLHEFVERLRAPEVEPPR